MLNRTLQVAMAMWLASAATGQIVAVPPAPYPPNEPAKKTTASNLLTSADAPRVTIMLPPLSDTEKKKVKSASTTPQLESGPARDSKNVKRKRLAVGFPRSLPYGECPLFLNGLEWQSLAGGGRATRIDIRSPGAAATRLGIELASTDPAVALRFVGSARPQQVFGPYPGDKIAEAKLYWSPVLEGETATIEVYLPANIEPSALRLAIPSLSHIIAPGIPPNS